MSSPEANMRTTRRMAQLRANPEHSLVNPRQPQGRKSTLKAEQAQNSSENGRVAARSKQNKSNVQTVESAQKLNQRTSRQDQGSLQSALSQTGKKQATTKNQIEDETKSEPKIGEKRKPSKLSKALRDSLDQMNSEKLRDDFYSEQQKREQDAEGLDVPVSEGIQDQDMSKNSQNGKDSSSIGSQEPSQVPKTKRSKEVEKLKQAPGQDQQCQLVQPEIKDPESQKRVLRSSRTSKNEQKSELKVQQGPKRGLNCENDSIYPNKTQVIFENNQEQVEIQAACEINQRDRIPSVTQSEVSHENDSQTYPQPVHQETPMKETLHDKLQDVDFQIQDQKKDPIDAVRIGEIHTGNSHQTNLSKPEARKRAMDHHTQKQTQDGDEEMVRTEPEQHEIVEVDDFTTLNQQFQVIPTLSRKRDIKGNYKAKLAFEKLIIEAERKNAQVEILKLRHQQCLDEIESLQNRAGEKLTSEAPVEPAWNLYTGSNGKTYQYKAHHDYLIKEMLWMQEDFDREHKKKVADAKKQARMCRRELQERQIKKEKQVKEQRHEIKRKANHLSKMVQLFWRSCEKIVRHNFGVQFEKRKQQARAKKLENFVSKHLRLSVKVAEELNTKSFVDQSMYDKTKINLNEAEQAVEDQKMEENKTQVKIYDSQDDFEEKNPEDGENAHMTSIAEQTVKMAEQFQPKSLTLEGQNISTKVPFILKGNLREYQIIGLDWLVTLHNKRLNGILADEMGLGKTIQTISMLASLACDRGIWGPHLIVVPTTIMINWEMEFKRWAPGFKILTYFGNQKERKQKRHGWSKDNSFHVCITSYKLVIQDHFAFRRKKWYYMVLDEAQNIKNFKSQRWQTLLRFNTKRRLLLTGTPLQNDVMELWSLMHFLMPQIFSDQQDFKEWFSNPFSQSINKNQSLNIGVVQKLQSILRPFLLRRLKKDVEKQLPEKIEHIVQCNLSRRQRLLYDEYINNDKTRETLQDSDFFSIMNVLMQLRKVCNHPDLFEARTIESPFIVNETIQFPCPSLIFNNLISKECENRPFESGLNVKNMHLYLPSFENLSALNYETIKNIYPTRSLAQAYSETVNSKNKTFCREKILSQRPGQEGQAISRGMFNNCNLLAQTNTHNLRLAYNSLLDQQFSNQQNTVLTPQQDFYYPIPNYLNTACLPFAQQHYSLPTFAALTNPRDHAMLADSTFSPSTATPTQSTQTVSPIPNKSAFSEEQKKQKNLQYGKRLLSLVHYDLQNRLALQLETPVYGTDLRHSVKVSLLFDKDFFDAKKSHSYTYSSCGSSQPVPSSVFNPLCRSQQRTGGNWDKEKDLSREEGMIGCWVTDWPDDERRRRDEAGMGCWEMDAIKTDLIVDVTPVARETDIGEKSKEVVSDVEGVDLQIKEDPSEDQMRNEEEEESVKEDQIEMEKESLPTRQIDHIRFRNGDTLRELIVTPLQRIFQSEETIKHFKCIIPKVVAKPVHFVPTKINTGFEKEKAYERFAYQKLMSHKNVNQSLKWANILFFPHKNLIQYDCGKLQRLAQLLKTLYVKGSKVLIFTQMTRMLDILEQFLNLHGYTYVRLDGSVKVEARQKMVDRFNLDPRVFCFISSTRCGGIGINLTGADCVIFFDTDWNPAMDKQAQDRSHRIGQTKTVHIYRLISLNTIEENIFKKSLQKRELGGLIIENSFDVDMFSKLNMKDLLTGGLDTSSLLKPKIRNILEEENIIFHHHSNKGDSLAVVEQDGQDDQERQAELEAYRRRFEEAMIQIEDEEDIEAYRDARAEIDNEFDERAENQQEEDADDIQTEHTIYKSEHQQTNHMDQEMVALQKEGSVKVDQGQDMGAKTEEEIQKEQAALELKQHQEIIDRSNASGVSKDLKKNEAIDWKNHEMLNRVTKYALAQFEQHFTFDQYVIERQEKEEKVKGQKSTSGQSHGIQNKQVSFDKDDADGDDKSSDHDSFFDEDEDENSHKQWEREAAEKLFRETQASLTAIYETMEDKTDADQKTKLK